MTAWNMAGTIALVLGVILLVVGINASHAMADHWSNVFTGHFTKATTWYMLGGVASVLVGLLLLLVRRRRSGA